jgi:hypothetical protein
MSPRPSDGPRSGHTFYLTPECWDALDEAHSEQRRKARRTGQPPPNKTQFAEQVIWAGLDALELLNTPEVEAPAAIPEPPPAPANPRTSRRRLDPAARFAQISEPGRPVDLGSAAEDTTAS